MERPESASTAIDKALDVLFHLHAAAEPQALSALARSLGLPRSSAHRLLSALKRRGLVEQADGGRYRPGIGLVALAAGVLERDPLVGIARPVLEAGAERLGDTMFLVAARAGTLRVLDKAEGTGVVRASPRLGTAIPIHATAVGKLYLALAPDELAPETAREAFTLHTVTDDAALTAEIRRARARGYACNRQEWVEGLSVIAAPIIVSERLHGAVCAALPSARLEQLEEAHVARHVIEAAQRVSQRMQGRSAA